MYYKKLTDAIKEELLECFNAEYDGKETALNEVKRYMSEFRFEPDYNIYRYGNIRPYYSQIRSLFEEVEYPNIPEDNEKLCLLFCKYVGNAARQLVKEK